jgi:hypothetical protein
VNGVDGCVGRAEIHLLVGLELDPVPGQGDHHAIALVQVLEDQAQLLADLRRHRQVTSLLRTSTLGHHLDVLGPIPRLDQNLRQFLDVRLGIPQRPEVRRLVLAHADEQSILL